jgi:hypothetical protein
MDPNDLFRFLLALALMPIVFRIGSRIRMPRGRRAFALGVTAVVVAFGMAAVGRVVPWDGLKSLRHMTFALGGFSLAWAAWSARRHELATNGAKR